MTEYPNVVEMEKFVLSSMLLKNGENVAQVASLLTADDFYRPEHRVTFNAILALAAKGINPNLLSLTEELRANGKINDVGIEFVLALGNIAFTTAYTETYCQTIKEKANLRRLIAYGEKVTRDAKTGLIPVNEIIAAAQSQIGAIKTGDDISKISTFNSYFKNQFLPAVEDGRIYSERKTGFENIDKHQLFSSGLYVIGAVPAAGKTTFIWQLLEQLARNGEPCIFCSYEMSALELYAKSIAREILNRNPDADPATLTTAAAIRRGNITGEVAEIIDDFSNLHLPLKVCEMHNENVDELLNLLEPFCKNQEKAPIIAIDYLQIIPSNKDIRLGIDDTVRKLKSFQRATKTTFIVISAFNRNNYYSSVGYESFKESGGIEYTADVILGLQLHAMNKIKGGADISKIRQKIDEAKKRHPRQIQLKCLKNRLGCDYDCYFNYFAANDTFQACDGFEDDEEDDSDEKSRQIDEVLKFAGGGGDVKSHSNILK